MKLFTYLHNSYELLRNMFYKAKFGLMDTFQHGIQSKIISMQTEKL